MLSDAEFLNKLMDKKYARRMYHWSLDRDNTNKIIDEVWSPDPSMEKNNEKLLELLHALVVQTIRRIKSAYEI
eukprot:UN00774